MRERERERYEFLCATDPVLAIDSPLWEHPEVEVVVTEPTSFYHHNYESSLPSQHHHNDVGEHTPIIQHERTVLIMDTGRCSEEEDEVNERMPLLSDGRGGGGDGDISGLSLPLNLARRLVNFGYGNCGSKNN